MAEAFGSVRSSRFASVAQAKWLWPLIALLLLLLGNFFFTPKFFDLELKNGFLYGLPVDILNRGAPIMLIALGMTLVIATKGVDLSVGAIVAVAGALAASLVQPGGRLEHGPILLVVAIALAASLILGVWNGVLVAFFDVQPMVATLILMVSGRGLAQYITGGNVLTFKENGLTYLGTGYFLQLPVSVTVVFVVFLVTVLLTRLTAMGLFVEAVGDNETASRYAGIRVKAVKLFAYVFCGLCAGVAGLVGAGNIGGADGSNAGLNFELDAILAVVIGGTSMAGGRFYLVGSILGALVIQTLSTTLLAHGVEAERQLVVKALAVLAVCLLQSPQFRAKVLGRKAT
jgi:ribose/xylose/arabinose/galactoside ABC-type transport system permease subunit